MFSKILDKHSPWRTNRIKKFYQSDWISDDTRNVIFFIFQKIIHMTDYKSWRIKAEYLKGGSIHILKIV